METLVIDRGKWLTGSAHQILGESTLRERRSGLMCCLGFYGDACGLSHDQITGLGTITTAAQNTSALANMQWLSKSLLEKDRKRFSERNVQWALINVNDKDNGIHQTRREAAIKYLFKTYGEIDVTFTGRYAEATSKARKAVKKNAN